MIVRPIRILNQNGDEIPRHPSIRVGAEYLVLEVYIAPDRRMVRLLDDEGGAPGLWPLEMFEVVSPRICADWGAAVEHVNGEAYLTLAPVAWLRPCFWTDYFDRAWEGAGDEFERALTAMAAEEGLPPSGRPDS